MDCFKRLRIVRTHRVSRISERPLACRRMPSCPFWYVRQRWILACPPCTAMPHRLPCSLQRTKDDSPQLTMAPLSYLRQCTSKGEQGESCKGRGGGRGSGQPIECS
jgi:hypothetical protein